MLIKQQAKKLRELIEDYAEAKADAEMAGSQPPAEADAIRLYERHSRDVLSMYISDLVK